VLDRKVSRGISSSSLTAACIITFAASGNFGQVLPKELSGCDRERIGSSVREVASVVGPLCTPLDLLADRMDLARAEEAN